MNDPLTDVTHHEGIVVRSIPAPRGREVRNVGELRRVSLIGGAWYVLSVMVVIQIICGIVVLSLDTRRSSSA